MDSRARVPAGPLEVLHTTDGSHPLPRAQSGQEPQRLLTILLGDYWYERHDALPSAALVALLQEFGVSEASARATLRRLTQRGLLVGTREGRNTAYAIPHRSRADIVNRLRRIFVSDTDPWDGLWTLASFSIPEPDRDLRRNLRDGLRYLGMRPLFDGVWVTPLDRAQAARQVATELGVDAFVVTRGHLEGMTDEAVVARAFEVSSLAEAYSSFTRQYADDILRMRAGEMSPREALRVRTAVIADWRRLMVGDPGLPSGLLPPSCPRGRVREVASSLYDGLAILALERVRQVLAPFGSELADKATAHTFSSVRRLAEVDDAGSTQDDAGTGRDHHFDRAADRHRMLELKRAGARG